MEKILKITEDGSHTLFVPSLNENYHSTHGAIQESSVVFIDAGLKEISKSFNQINILEVGFGTGLNALLTYCYSVDNQININYTAIEPYPVSADIYEKLNFAEQLKRSELKPLFHRIHQAEGSAKIFENHFSFSKTDVKIEDLLLVDNQYHLIYFDAFAPDVQPELWTPEIFLKLFNSLVSGGILTTYSAKGAVKRALKSAGFIIESLPGPPGKREITRAKKA